MKFKSLCCAALLLLTQSPLAQAEQKQTLGSWDVHYIAMPSTLIDPKIATQYQITRSIQNGLINISVLNTSDQQAQQVRLSGQAKNLLGQIKELDFKEVREGKAIYYLAQLQFRGEEKLNFSIDIQQGTVQQQLKFEHTFYPEEL
jgi:hypothetical protein